MESQLSPVFVSVCMWWSHLGPCRALAVLIRQPQPSREHQRERRKMGGRGGEERMVGGKYYLGRTILMS